MTLATRVKNFCDGAKEGWHDEQKAIKKVSTAALFPILCAIEGYKYLTTKGEANPFFTIDFVSELVHSPSTSVAALVCSPAAIVTVPLGVVADAALLSSSPFYMFYKGCKGPTTTTGLQTALMSSSITPPQYLLASLPAVQQPGSPVNPETSASDDDLVIVSP